MQRMRIKCKALFSDKFVTYNFGGINWQHFLYDFTLDGAYTPYTQDIQVGTITSTTTVKIGDLDFIYPLPIKHTTLLDGVLRGFVKIKYKTSNATYKAYLQKVMVILKAFNENGKEREIEKYGIATTLDTISTTGEIASIPFFFDISSEKKDAGGNIISELKCNERIRLEIALYGKMENAAATGTYYLSCEINKDDLYVDIPVV